MLTPVIERAQRTVRIGPFYACWETTKKPKGHALRYLLRNKGLPWGLDELTYVYFTGFNGMLKTYLMG